MLPLIYHPDYSPPFPAGHRFPMAKFAHLHDQLLAAPTATQVQVTAPACIAAADVLRVHCPRYLDAFRQGTLGAAEIKRSGLPWSPGLVQRTLRECGGTLATARLALAQGLACHLAGGTHHARRDHGAGFCLLNDLAITATTLRQQGEAGRILILDCDVHQGDGTAELLAQTAGVWAVSLHAARNYPARKAVSHWDIPLPSGLTDADYLRVLRDCLDWLLPTLQPDLVLYDAGVDVHVDDALGLLALTDDGILARDRLVLSRCRAAGIPVAAVLGGGYDPDPRVVARRHGLLVQAALAVTSASAPSPR